MKKAFKLAIVRARHDLSVSTISDQACLEMLMTGGGSVLRFWEETTGGYFDFLDSAMLPWVDITIAAAATARGEQAKAAFAAIRARESGHDPLAGFDGAIVLTLPGRMTVANPKAGQPGEPATIVSAFDGGSTTVNGLPVSVLPVMSSDHTFMCHELGHTLGFGHTYGLDNNGTDWNPTDSTIIVGPEYGSPYDLMSSASFGSKWLGTAPFYSATPTFTGAAVPNWPFPGAAQMGPNISRANLHRWFPEALTTHVVDRPFPARGEIGRVRLQALSSGRGPTLLVLHPPGEPSSGVGRIYVEYRSANGWDKGLDVSGADLAQVGVVVHTLDDVAGAVPGVWYRGSVAIGSADTDLEVATRAIVITLDDRDDSSWVDISYRQAATVVPKADILWANASDGTLQIWVMNSGRVAKRLTVVNENGQPERIAAPWRVVATGDFSRDGNADILWANASDGAMQIWIMNGGRVARRVPVIDENGQPERIGAPWRVVGAGDFNRNGNADILWANTSDGTMQIWAMNGGRVAGRVSVVNENGQPERVGAPWRVLGTGDFNRDGNADILWANASDGTMQIWVMDGGRVAGRVTVVNENGQPERIGAPWRVVGTGDFNRDGNADILWANASDGTMQIWVMDGGRVARRVTVVAENGQPERIGMPWHVVGTRGPNLIGAADILWHNNSTGETQFWIMDNAKVAKRATVLGEDGKPGLIGPPWSIVATGDFNLNVTPDILWHNSSTAEIQIWFMDGFRVASRATVLGEDGKPAFVGAPWSIVGTGDFNLNASADILWHNSATAETQIWFMDGYRVASRATVLGEDGKPVFIGRPWSIVGTGDFNVNGNADILWYNSATGETQIWFMDRFRVASRATVLGEDGKAIFIGPPWSIVGCRDFNLNGTADILWYNSLTGETQIWFMDGARVAARATVLGEDGKPVLVGPPWSIVEA